MSNVRLKDGQNITVPFN